MMFAVPHRAWQMVAGEAHPMTAPLLVPALAGRRARVTSGARRVRCKTGLRRIAILASLCTAALVSATWAAESAREILDRRKTLDDGPRRWTDRYQRMRLAVEDGGVVRRLELETYDRREHERQKSLVVFIAPAEKAGIGLLSHTAAGRSSNQWLYTPTTRRVRMVARGVRLNRFDITDFTYHDLDVLTEMPNWSEQDARSKLRPGETIDGVACHVIELEPHLEHIAYARIVVWLGQDDLVPRQIEFYSEPEQRGFFDWAFGRERDAGQPVRRFRQMDIRSVGSIPVAHRIEVETPADHSRTTIDVVEVRFDRGLSDAFFSPGSLDTRAK